MKWLSVSMAILTAFIMASDIAHLAALAASGQQSPNAVAMLNLAGRLNPKSMTVRMDQVESLMDAYRSSMEQKYLDEAVYIAKSIVSDYRGNAQAYMVLSTVMVMDYVHTKRLFPGAAAEEAIRRDSISIPAIENQMFALTVARQDNAEFKRLGIKRAALTDRPLRMRCGLCGRHWLRH